MKKLLILSALVLAAGCASAGNRDTQTSSDRNVLTAEDLQNSGLQSAYTAVQTLRPHWLRQRGPSSINVPVELRVYLDSNLMGGPEFLRNINIQSITSMKFLSGMEATQRYGLDHGMGAIIVLTR